MTKRKKYIVQRIRDRIKEKDVSAEVILYGSHATGKANEDSDWDILILLDRDDITLKVEQEYRHHLLDLELEIGEPITVSVYSRKTWETRHSVTLLYRSINREGVPLL